MQHELGVVQARFIVPQRVSVEAVAADKEIIISCLFTCTQHEDGIVAVLKAHKSEKINTAHVAADENF